MKKETKIKMYLDFSKWRWDEITSLTRKTKSEKLNLNSHSKL